MTIAYRIYSNHGAGGPVDYSNPVGTSAGETYAVGPLGVSTDNTFVVRAYDPASGLEQAGSEASVRVVVGPDGTDLSGLPNAPHSVSLSPAGGGGARVSWVYAPAGASGTPARFDVFLTSGPAVDYTSRASTVPYTPGKLGYSCTLPGPFPLSTYSAAVRSSNAVGTEGNSASAGAVMGLPAPFAMEPVGVMFGPLGR